MPWWAWTIELYAMAGLWVVEQAATEESQLRDDIPVWVWNLSIMGVMLGWPLIMWAVVREELDKKSRNR